MNSAISLHSELGTRELNSHESGCWTSWIRETHMIGFRIVATIAGLLCLLVGMWESKGENKSIDYVAGIVLLLLVLFSLMRK